MNDGNHPGTLVSGVQYNPAGGHLAASLGNGVNETLAYDQRLRLQSLTAVKDTTTVYSFSIVAYAPNSNVLTGNDSVNGNWAYGYDDFNRLTSANKNSGQEVYGYVYDRFGDRWQQNGPHQLSLGFDANNRIVGGGVTYDAAGNVTYDGQTSYTYDAENRIISTSGTLGSATYVYNAAGMRVRKTTGGVSVDYLYDLAGKQRCSFTDALGRLTQVDEPNPALSTPALTTYTYDVLDNLLTVVQSGSRQRTFTYNSLSQPTQAVNPESGTISYTYDNDGNVVTKTDARSITACFGDWSVGNCNGSTGYDALHRLLKKTYSNGDPAVSYFYDQTSYNGLTITNGKGRRTGMSDAAGLEAWTYDAMGRVLVDRRTTNSITRDFTYAYNLDGSLDTLTYPTNPSRTIKYSYNAAARALSAVDQANGINYATGALYTAGGSLSSLTSGASLVSTFFYNSRLQPCRISAKSSGTAPANCADTSNVGNMLDFRYSFNLGTANNGNVARIENRRDMGRSQTFTYDELNRIKSAVTDATSGPNCWGQLFGHMNGSTYVSGYDIWANLKEITPDPSRPGCAVNTLTLSIGTNNRIIDTGFQYDAAGNLTNTPNPGGLTMTYDAENRMTSVAGVTYAYDGDGKRVKKSNGKLYWYRMSGDVLLETDLAGNNGTEFVFFNGKRIARRDPAGTISYFFGDHLSSSRVVTNSSGGIVEDSDFYPFGGERTVVDTLTDQNYKFTGKERDNESSLDYFGARYHGSGLGRFLSVDPAGLSVALGDPQSWNRYSYVQNRPLVYVDPNGKWPEWFHNRIIEDVFKDFSPEDRQVLKDISRIVDMDQSLEGSYKHGMSYGGESSPGEASASSLWYIHSNLETAVVLEVSSLLRGDATTHANALYFFGKALHTVTDMTSPSHEGFQQWAGLRNPAGLSRHAGTEVATSFGGSPFGERNRAEAYYQAMMFRTLFVAKVEKELKGRCEKGDKKACEELKELQEPGEKESEQNKDKGKSK